MPRPRRAWVSQEVGSFHLISRIVGAEIILHDEEKEYFLKLMERFSSGFFVAIHAFCIMGNHFHILATGLELEAERKRRKRSFITVTGRCSGKTLIHPLDRSIRTEI
ncbi:MAG: hypothetical protein KAW12_18630 [Candidatus Aminicenantes bacterium]|nr:hypothetical protein [Candidatus Aminicenantes bacterium]